ncbi:hypothetical protein AVEN_191093-1 [Araneus ventricosus]|uniref:Uncharacterized protein n=1 Tax=Araneus ventricosus TaxID=182803 RepID=A0A4Y2AXZ6_ARAVE|nr:hypothetical protein AVEN_191093-1 [Araneus ventricosus]
MEQLRRCSKAASTEILFDENIIATLSQEKFLTNTKNKSSLIGLLTVKFKAVGIPVKQAENDADSLIAETTLMIFKHQHNSTVIVGCGSACGCRKLGLHYSIACANCHGQSCLNPAPIEGISGKEIIVGTEEIDATNEIDLM